MASEQVSDSLRLKHDVDPARDHIRGTRRAGSIVVVGYLDFLCPYCRRLYAVFRRIRDELGERFVYAFRHFPIERAHPGAELAGRAVEAAGRQGKFFEMHDEIFERELPIGRPELVASARSLNLDLEQFERDLDSEEIQQRIQRDMFDGRENGITGAPTLFVDGVRYDGAWDHHSVLEGLEQPVAVRLARSARVFASLPISAGLSLLSAAVLAIVCANSPLGNVYRGAMDAVFGIGTSRHAISLPIREWVAEGLLSFFFLIVGLEIRRELASGALVERRAALLPIIAAVGGIVVPALIYLAANHGGAAVGWPIPTATDVAFVLGVLALFGNRIPTELRVFVATLAVVDDVLSIGVIALYSPNGFEPIYAVAVAASLILIFALNKARVYASWPYVFAGVALWLSLHLLGVHAALTGVVLAFCLPSRPEPTLAPLLAQAATALSSLDHVEKEAQRDNRELKLSNDPVWGWAARNLSATAERLRSPAERIEGAVAPWSAFLILPLFAFSATGVGLHIDFSSPDAPHVFGGIVLGLALGKPLGILAATALLVVSGIAVMPERVTRRQLVGAACLCGIGDMLSLLTADRAFDASTASVAKLAVLAGSVVAATLGSVVLRRS